MTDVRILSCVYVGVELHPLLADKSQSTELALVGPLPRVEPAVTLHGSHLCTGALLVRIHQTEKEYILEQKCLKRSCIYHNIVQSVGPI